LGGKKKKNRSSRRFLTRVWITCLKIFLCLVFFSALQVLLFRFVDPPVTVPMLWGWAKGAAGGKPYAWPGYRWRPLEKISPHLLRAVLAGEDQRFFRHHGFDFVELEEAVRDLLHSGRVRGASTITMQTARSLFLWPGRSLVRKALEAYYTILIELFWEKRRILEVYLNTVDWGEGAVGAEAASRKYFRRSADRLTLGQAAALAAVLPSPHRWSPVDPNRRVLERKRRILRDMKSLFPGGLPVRLSRGADSRPGRPSFQ